MKPKYRVDINISLMQVEPYGGSGRLEIREAVDLSAGNFFELAAILGRFHELAETLKAEENTDGS